MKFTIICDWTTFYLWQGGTTMAVVHGPGGHWCLVQPDHLRCGQPIRSDNTCTDLFKLPDSFVPLSDAK